eukprot:3947403-Pyramimonas_sp.AAC.1
MGFLKDPTLQDTYMSITSPLVFTEEVEEESEWISKKQLLEQYDSSEAEEMIESEKILVQLFQKSSILPASFNGHCLGRPLKLVDAAHI